MKEEHRIKHGLNEWRKLPPGYRPLRDGEVIQGGDVQRLNPEWWAEYPPDGILVGTCPVNDGWYRKAEDPSDVGNPVEDKKHYLLDIYAGVESRQVLGPYETEEDRDAAARELRQKQGEEDGIFWVDVWTDGRLEVGAYCNGFFEPDFFQGSENPKRCEENPMPGQDETG